MSTRAEASPDASDTVLSATLRVWPLLLGICLLLAGNGLQGSLLGLVAEDQSFSSAMTGIIMAAYFVGFLIGSQVSELFISRVGHVRTFAAFASLGSVAILVHGIFIEPLTWTTMRLVTGFCFAGLYVVAESWLNRETTSEHRGGLLAVYMIVTHVGLASGQGLLNLAPPSGLSLYVVASIVLSLAVLPMLLSSAPQPHFEFGREQMGIRKLWRVTPLGTGGCFLAGMANGIVLGMAAVYARRLGLDVASISVFMAAIMIGGAVFQWPIGKVSDRIDRRWVILAVAIATALATLAMQMVASNTLALVAAAFVLGGFVLVLYPLFLSYANDWFNAEQLVSASSGLVMVYGAGAMVGPIGTGFFMGRFGTAGFTGFLVALMLVTVVFTALRIRATPGPDNQEDFLATPATVGVSEYWAEGAAESAESTENDEAATGEVASLPAQG
jgi:MFS family permease